MDHFMTLVNASYKQLSAGERGEFLDCLFNMQRDNLKRIKEEIDWFSKKFDYRYKDEPWGNSKDAVVRGIKKLAGNARTED